MYLTTNDNWEGRFNACTKIYPNGHTKTTVFNFPVYNPLGLFTESKTRTCFDKANNVTRNDSIKRGIDKVYDIALLNDFQYFVTLTLDQNKIDRYDYTEICKKVKNWLNNACKRYNCKYLIVPELHEDGAVHFHGLLSGDFTLVDSGKKYQNKPIYNLDNWHYGFTTCMQLTGNKEAVAKYICKYITKDTKRILGNLYYAGGGITREPQKEYALESYPQAKGKEYVIANTSLKVKYDEVI